MQFRHGKDTAITPNLAQIVNGAAGLMVWAHPVPAGLFVGMVLLQHIGHDIGTKRIALDPDRARKGAGVIEGAVFGLLSLLLAFTFSGAVARFDTRRQLVSEEAIRIGTAFDRIKLLPPEAQPELRDLFKRYLDARLEIYRNPGDAAETTAAWQHSLQLQAEIWTRSVEAGKASPTTVAGMLFLPAVNQMVDITRTRLTATRMHPPAVVYGMLAITALIGALFAGYHMAGGKARNWLHTIGFALVISATAYVILDIEYPRLGLIRVDAADELLRDLRRQMD